MNTIRYSKAINSVKLKKDLDKKESIENARLISQSVNPGKELSNCPICLHSEFSFLCNIYGFNYVNCQYCGSALVRNPPDDNDLRDLYVSQYYTESNKKLYANDSLVDYRIEQIAKPKVSHILGSIKSKPSSWLDIGCGTGEIISVANDSGLRAVGIETNPMQREYARKRFGLDINDEYITPENINQFGGNFDIISMFSVLEHVLNPRDLIHSVTNIQNSGNHIVIEVPHYPSLSVASQMTYPDYVNRMMHPPFHLFIFSEKAIEMLFKEYGYEAINYWFFGQDVYEYLTTLELVAGNFNGSRLKDILWPLIEEMQMVVDKNGYSDEMLVIGRKL